MVMTLHKTFEEEFAEELEVRCEKQAEEIDHLEYGIERYEWWCKHDQAEIKKLKKGIAGRDKTILAWLAKSKRLEKKIKKSENQCFVNLIAFNCPFTTC